MNAFEPDPDLTIEELRRVASLTQDQLDAIDAILLSIAAPEWQKVARIAASAVLEARNAGLALPDLFYAARVRNMVARGILESRGDLQLMGFSEVRIARQP